MSITEGVNLKQCRKKNTTGKHYSYARLILNAKTTVTHLTTYKPQ